MPPFGGFFFRGGEMTDRVEIRSGVYRVSRSTKHSAGYDLRCTESFTVTHGEITIVSTGVYVRMPVDTMGMVCSRSGLATKGIIVVNAPGIIDPDYTQEVKVIMTRLIPGSVSFTAGDRIAQLVFTKWLPTTVDANTTFAPERTGGFGSTGEK